MYLQIFQTDCSASKPPTAYPTPCEDSGYRRNGEDQKPKEAREVT
jgi:hypothetical protein